MSVATYKVKDLSAQPFVACFNCQSILVGAHIVTGVKIIE